jgi:hypothetical protein
MIKNDDGIVEYLCKGQQGCRCSNNNMVIESQKEKVRTVSNQECNQSVSGCPPWNVINSLGFSSVIGYFIILNYLLVGSSKLPRADCQSSTNEDSRA